MIPLAQLKQRPNHFVVTHRGEDIYLYILSKTDIYHILGPDEKNQDNLQLTNQLAENHGG